MCILTWCMPLPRGGGEVRLYTLGRREILHVQKQVFHKKDAMIDEIEARRPPPPGALPRPGLATLGTRVWSACEETELTKVGRGRRERRLGTERASQWDGRITS